MLPASGVNTTPWAQTLSWTHQESQKNGEPISRVHDTCLVHPEKHSTSVEVHLRLIGKTQGDVLEDRSESASEFCYGTLLLWEGKNTFKLGKNIRVIFDSPGTLLEWKGKSNGWIQKTWLMTFMPSKMALRSAKLLTPTLLGFPLSLSSSNICDGTFSAPWMATHGLWMGKKLQIKQ